MAENSRRFFRHKEITSNDRKVLYWTLQAMHRNGSLPRNSYAIVAHQLNFAPRAVGDAYREIRKLVSEWHETNGHDAPIPDDLFSNRRSHCGRKQFWNRSDIAEHVRSLPLKDRGNYRALEGSTGVPRTTLHNMHSKDAILKHHRASLKPILTDANRFMRLEYALQQIAQGRNTRSAMVFKDQMDVVHVDEKWFFIIKEGQRYILVADEIPPPMYTRNKNSLEKVMFLSALARPRVVGNTYWDGKIGIWPVGYVGKAKKKSKYRNRGDPVWVNENVDRTKYTEMIMNDVLPAVAAKWPLSQWNDPNFVVRIQQDGARSHIPEDSDNWFELLTQVEMENKIKLYTQPANSPDTNVNDLGFFAALQASYYKHNPRNSFDIIDCVKKSFDSFCPRKLNRIWLTYQTVLNSIIEKQGGNDYKLTHMNKAKLERENRLPHVLPVTEAAKQYLHGQQTIAEELEDDSDKENTMDPNLQGHSI